MKKEPGHSRNKSLGHLWGMFFLLLYWISLFKKAEDVDYNVLCIYKGLKNNEQGCTYFCRLELQITVKSIMIKKDYYMSMWIRELIPRFSQERNTFMSIWEAGCLLCLSRSSGHKVCRSNCYAIHLKLIKCCMSAVTWYN